MSRQIRSNLLLALASLTLCVVVGATLALAHDSRDQVVPGGPLVPASKFSVDDTNMPVADAVRSLFQQAGKKYVFDLPATGVVTCHASNLSFFDALNILLSSCDPPLRYAIRDSIYHVGPLGTITGRVTLGSGKPAAGYTVVASPAQFSPLRDDPNNPNKAVTDAEGRYSITLRKELPLKNGLGARLPFLSVHFGANHILAKGYTVSVSLKGQSYMPPPDQNADPSSNPDWTATGIDFILQPSPAVVVKVTDAITGSPIPGVDVKYNAQWGLPSELGVTDDSGEIRSTIPTLNTDLFATLKPSPSAFEFAPGYGSGQQTSLKMNTSPGKTIAWNLKTYGTEKMSNWHGVVLGADGKAVGPGVTVRLLRGRQQYPPAESTVTDSQGRFSIDAYRFDRDETGDYPSGPRPVAFAQYNDMTAAAIVTPDESWDGITLRLAPGASISGTLVDPQGKPAAFVNATLSGAILGEQQWRYSLPVQPTDSNGQFKIANLPPGDYRIAFSGGGYSDTAFPLRTDQYGKQTLLRLTAGEQKTVGRITDPKSEWNLAVQIVDKTGKPVPSVAFKLTGDHTDRSVVADPGGKFAVKNLASEPLTAQLNYVKDAFTAQIPAGMAHATITLPDRIAEKYEHLNASSANSTDQRKPAVAGQPRFIATGLSTPLDGLALAIRKDSGGLCTSAIIRPNSLSLFDSRFQAIRWAPGRSLLAPIWQGALADLDGMHFTVRANHGVLADRAGRTLWSGVVIDPPDFIITEHRLKSGIIESAVRSSSGKTVWSGAGAATVNNQSIIVYTADHKIAWQRGIGNERVEIIGSGDGARPADDWKPFDGAIDLHVISENAVLTSQDGKTLLTGATQAVRFTLTGFTPVPEALIENPGPHPEAHARLLNESVMLPQEFQALLGVQNAPPDSKLSFADTSGKPLGPTYTLNPTPKPVSH